MDDLVRICSISVVQTRTQPTLLLVWPGLKGLAVYLQPAAVLSDLLENKFVYTGLAIKVNGGSNLLCLFIFQANLI